MQRGLVIVGVALCLGACGGVGSPGEGEAPFETLSSYGLFLGDGSSQEPVTGVIPYDLNTPLFSDYTEKYRFIRLPENTSATYDEEEAFAFPVGTIIAKTFAYPYDLRAPEEGRRLLETRLLIHEGEGWVGLPYLWNEAQTEAYLEIAGGTVDATWTHTDGRMRTNNYIVPNVNQCKGCHRMDGETMSLLGVRARHVNRDFAYPHGPENQLAYWSRVGALVGGPPPEEAPRLPVWDDETTGTLEERARAWLEINCAHCHNPQGPARSSTLDLRYSQRDPVKWGVAKAPVAAGRGSGGRLHDIVPGRPEASILVFRITSTEPGVAMPELGKRLVHEEGVALIREWIETMEDPRTARGSPGTLNAIDSAGP